MLTEAQSSILYKSLERVEVCDDQGVIVGYLPAQLSKEDLKELRRRINSNEPRYTTSQVLAHLESLGKQEPEKPQSNCP